MKFGERGTEKNEGSPGASAVPTPAGTTSCGPRAALTLFRKNRARSRLPRKVPKRRPNGPVHRGNVTQMRSQTQLLGLRTDSRSFVAEGTREATRQRPGRFHGAGGQGPSASRHMTAFHPFARLGVYPGLHTHIFPRFPVHPDPQELPSPGPGRVEGDSSELPAVLGVGGSRLEQAHPRAPAPGCPGTPGDGWVPDPTEGRCPEGVTFSSSALLGDKGHRVHPQGTRTRALS